MALLSLILILTALLFLDTGAHFEDLRDDVSITLKMAHGASGRRLNAKSICPKLVIANSEKIRYSDPKGPNGIREEGSKATYICMAGFKRAGYKKPRVCKRGKFDGAQQLCVGTFCADKDY